MKYDEITYETILNRMLDRVPNNVDKREGSIIYDALAPAALELAILYVELGIIEDEMFADTASREYLIRRAEERGLAPYEPTQAVLKVKVYPTDFEVPIGSRFNLDDLNYEITDKLIGDNYQMKCETAGRIGNKTFGNLLPIEYIDGLEKVEITSILIPGEDEEDTEDFRKRYFESFNSKSFGGNISNYVEVASALDGVGPVKVTPVWNGGGTVKLTILDSDYNKASSTLINTVQSEIDPSQDGKGLGIAPIGHIVTIDTVEELPIAVKTTLTLEEGKTFNDIKESIEAAIEGYLLSVRKKWANASDNENVVRISQIENRILNVEGVLDICETTINDSNTNISLTNNQIPVFESISENV